MATDGTDAAFEDEVEPTLTIREYIDDIEAEELEADLVLGGNDGDECTYTAGYLKRQAVFSCLTCVPAGVAGVCTACCLTCHDDHEKIIKKRLGKKKVLLIKSKTKARSKSTLLKTTENSTPMMVLAPRRTRCSTGHVACGKMMMKPEDFVISAAI